MCTAQESWGFLSNHQTEQNPRGMMINLICQVDETWSLLGSGLLGKLVCRGVLIGLTEVGRPP